jgi:hypothetical protein
MIHLDFLHKINQMELALSHFYYALLVCSLVISLLFGLQFSLFCQLFAERNIVVHLHNI